MTDLKLPACSENVKGIWTFAAYIILFGRYCSHGLPCMHDTSHRCLKPYLQLCTAAARKAWRLDRTLQAWKQGDMTTRQCLAWRCISCCCLAALTCTQDVGEGDAAGQRLCAFVDGGRCILRHALMSRSAEHEFWKR